MKDMLTCANCKKDSCYKGDLENAPLNCPTSETDPGREIARYDENEIRMARSAAIVEGRFYGLLTRVEEIMEFAFQMGYRHIGLGFCRGLADEAEVFSRILKANGFTVDSISCKNGRVSKCEIGVEREDFVVPDREDEAMCNPAGQAERLNEAGCELNVILGLCVGHDSLFIRHSKAPVTVLAAKDRVLGHNPLAAIYTADTYYKRLFSYAEDREKK